MKEILGTKEWLKYIIICLMFIGCATSPINVATPGDVAIPETPPKTVQVLGDIMRSSPGDPAIADSGIDPEKFLKWEITHKVVTGYSGEWAYMLFYLINPDKTSEVKEVETYIALSMHRRASQFIGYAYMLDGIEQIYTWNEEKNMFILSVEEPQGIEL